MHLILMACVFLCALGLAEPAAAHSPYDREHVVAGATVADGDLSDANALVHHHHCPVAPDLSHGGADERIMLSVAVPVRSPTAPLASLTRAPPVPPPATV